MKSIINVALAASLAAGAAAQPHNHHHAHLHKKQASPVEKREPDVVTEYAVGPTVTLYQLGGKEISHEKAEEGIEDGLFVVVGESKPTWSPPPPPPEPSTTSEAPESSTLVMAAQFFEEKETSSTPSPTPEPAPAPSSSSKKAPAPKPTTASGSGGSASGGSGLDSKFDDGKVKCSEFPSSYGALYLDWLGTKGWSGIQRVPLYNPGDSSITLIETAIDGEGCSPKSFCSYACPVGYQKTQWPEAQGSTRESIGGLYCNADGYLELTRPAKTKLCEPGVGGVYVKNDLDDIAAVCRTDYPGTESMVIPTIPQPGEKLALTNPSAPDYYVWDGKPTTAQYYVNKKGYSLGDSCVWNSPKDPKGAGNWAPINIGTGKAADGNTYISIFPNWPTTTDVLDFNIEIVGDVNSKCALIDGTFIGGSSTGCTVSRSSPSLPRPIPSDAQADRMDRLLWPAPRARPSSVSSREASRAFIACIATGNPACRSGRL